MVTESDNVWSWKSINGSIQVYITNIEAWVCGGITVSNVLITDNKGVRNEVFTVCLLCMTSQLKKIRCKGQQRRMLVMFSKAGPVLN